MNVLKNLDIKGTLSLVGTAVTATAAELNLLDGKTAVGDLSGPSSATDAHLAVFDSTTGKLIKDGGACSAAGLALMDDATAADQRATLGGVVVGPASAYDNAIARYDATTGKLVQNSILSVSDLGVIYNESSGLYMMAPYKQTFVDLSTTPVSFFGGNAMNQVACYNFRLTIVSGSFCTFQLFIGFLAGTAWKAVAIAGANCTLGGTPPTFTISGIGDTKTYTLAFSPDNATVTFKVDSTATGNTILSFVASG